MANGNRKAIAVLSRNKIAFYWVPKALFEKILVLPQDAELNVIPNLRMAQESTVLVTIDNL